MIKLSNYINSENILLLDAPSRDAVLQALTSCLAEQGKIKDKDAFLNAGNYHIIIKGAFFDNNNKIFKLNEKTKIFKADSLNMIVTKN